MSSLIATVGAKLKQAPLTATPLVGDDDEFDPFNQRKVDPAPESEGDDSVHAEGEPR